MKKAGGTTPNNCTNGHANNDCNGRADDEGGGQNSPPRVSYAAAARKPPSPQTLATPLNFNNTSSSGRYKFYYFIMASEFKFIILKYFYGC